jgi:hypothetical protein
MSSVTFSTGFHQIKPGLRVSGDEISVVYKSTYDSGLYAGKKYIHIDLTNETDLTFVEAGIAGPFDTIPDVDALYQQLLDAGMTEAFDGFLVDPSDMSVISVDGSLISFDFAGHQPYVFGRADDPSVTERVKVAHQTWTLPQADFAGAATLFAALESPEELEFRSIEERFATQENEFDTDILEVKGLIDDEAGARIAADDTLQDNIDGEASARAAADAALQTAVDINTTGLATEINQRQAGDTATESAANAYTDTKINDLINGAGPALDTLKELEDALTDNDSDIAALVVSVGNAQASADANTTGLATEINQRQAGDNALSGRLDVLEADPITNAEVVTIANDLQANRIQGDNVLRVDFEADDAALSARIDVLEADPTTQAALDAEITARTSADSALDTRVTSLEGNAAITDPTTATAVAAVQADVDANQTASESADSALSGRLDVLEADPTTQTLLDAETTARTEGDLNAIGQSNAYTDGLLNQYFGGAADELKSDSYTAVIQAGFTPTVDATAGQFKFNNADVASVTAIAINHDSNAGRIDWFEVFPTGSVLRVTRASDSAVFDFTVTQAGTGGVNNRTKNFTVTTSSTGTLADGDSLSISTVGGPDIAVAGDLTVGGSATLEEPLTINGFGTSTVYARHWYVPGSSDDRGIEIDTNQVKLVARYDGLGANGNLGVSWNFNNLVAEKNANGDVVGNLGTAALPWNALHCQSISVSQGINTTGTFSVGDAGAFTSPALPDNVSFADLLEAIGDALVARPKLDGSNIPGPYADDTAAATGGVAVGALYKHNNGQIHYRVS